jgi:hypothetical protein
LGVFPVALQDPRPATARRGNRIKSSRFGGLWRRGCRNRSGLCSGFCFHSFFAAFRSEAKLVSLPFVLAFGISQKIPPFGLFKIEYRKNGFLST